MGFLSKLDPRNWWGRLIHRPPVVPAPASSWALSSRRSRGSVVYCSAHSPQSVQIPARSTSPPTKRQSHERSASLYVQTLASSGRLDHYLNGSNPGSRMSAQGYAWSREGENIAAGQTSPQQVMTDWMSDLGHRQNILGSYQDVGFGMVSNFWVVDFAAPLASSHLPPVPHVKVVPRLRLL
jgi:hypothetical protein